MKSGRIHDRVENEYREGFRCDPEGSVYSFSLGERVEFIKAVIHSEPWASFGGPTPNINADVGAERRNLRHFTCIGSDLYPELSDHFERVFADSVAEGETEQALLGGLIRMPRFLRRLGVQGRSSKSMTLLMASRMPRLRSANPAE